MFGVTAASRNTRFQAARYCLTWTRLAPLCGDVVRAAGSKADDDAHRPRRIGMDYRWNGYGLVAPSCARMGSRRKFNQQTCSCSCRPAQPFQALEKIVVDVATYITGITRFASDAKPTRCCHRLANNVSLMLSGDRAGQSE